MSSENEVEIQNSNEKDKKKRSPISYVIEGIIYVLLIVICIYVVPTYVIQRTVVSGESMEDTLHDEESLLVDKLSYRFSAPKRYDIIVFYPKGKDVNEYYVKRIYGLPGETIQIKNNDIYINGSQIEDSYAKDAMGGAGIAEEPYTLASDEYFVLGDHRSVSLDSRVVDKESPFISESLQKHLDAFAANPKYSEVIDNLYDEEAPGPVKFENIAGKVFLRIWPLSKFGVP